MPSCLQICMFQHAICNPDKPSESTLFIFYDCRDVRNVCGVTREVLYALIADIETREWRRQEMHKTHLSQSTPVQVIQMTSNVLSVCYEIMFGQISP